MRAAMLARGHRQFVVLSGERTWSESLVAAAIHCDDAAILVAGRALAGHQPDVKAASLGIEADWVIIDAHSYNSVNHWLAAAGTLRAGGSLLLLTPPLADWPSTYAQAMRAQGFEVDYSTFIARLSRLLPTLPSVYVYEPEDEPSFSVPAMPEHSQAWRTEVPSPDQLACVSAIQRVSRGRAGRPLVIRADRGRGKTSALGLAAAELLRAGRQRVVISAARFDMVEIAFRRAAETLGDAQRHGRRLEWGGGCIEYLSPADVLSASFSDDVQPDIVMVDEAAHLPLPLLESMLERFPRVVFSTTVAGYEGTGRGFDIRFRKSLDRLRPHWRRHFLAAPMRWAADDPLEAVLNTVFLLSAADELSELVAGEAIVEEVSTSALSECEDTLRQVFQLLMEAHYQTTPQDLQYLLDLPANIHITRIGHRIVGVCQAQPEGGLPPELCDQVCMGRRRPKGNLVAQALAQRSGDKVWLSVSSWRINRIAVSQGVRRQGYASALLTSLEQWARKHGCAYLSSSFSCEPELLSFWAARGFRATHLGSRRDASSGNYSLMVVRPLATVSQRLDHQRELLRDELMSCATLLRGDMPSRAMAELMAELPSFASELDYCQLRRYAAGELSFEHAALHLMRVCVGARPTGSTLVIERLFKQCDWASLAAKYSLSGREGCEQQIRRYFSGELRHINHEQE